MKELLLRNKIYLKIKLFDRDLLVGKAVFFTIEYFILLINRLEEPLILLALAENYYFGDLTLI